MRALVIDDEAKAKVAQVLRYAEGHPYEPPDEPPGDNPHHVCMLSTYRCVFSFTISVETNERFRDLSISVPARGKYPNPVAAFAIAELFGFTGWDGKSELPPQDWYVIKDVDWPAIRVLQKVSL